MLRRSPLVSPKNSASIYRRHRFARPIIALALWLYFRFPLSLRMVEEMLVARGIDVTYEMVRRWAVKFGQAFARQIWELAQPTAKNGILMRWSSK